jgi:hypothetical protein
MCAKVGKYVPAAAVAVSPSFPLGWRRPLSRIVVRHDGAAMPCRCPPVIRLSPSGFLSQRGRIVGSPAIGYSNLPGDPLKSAGFDVLQT